MKNKIWSLTKVFLKNSFQFRIKNSKKTEKNMKNAAIKYFLILCLIIYIVGILAAASYYVVDSLIKSNQPLLFLGFLFMVVIFLALFQTIFSSINVLYFSKDIEHVLPLPIKPTELLIAKFNTILITEYMVEFIALIAPIVVYGVLTQMGFLFYFYAILLLLAVPILPMILVTFIIMLIMSFAKFTKDRDKFQLITTILTIVIIVGAEFLIIGNSTGISSEQLIQMLTKSNGLVEMLGKYFITLGPSINCLANYTSVVAVWELLKVVAITAAVYILFITVSNKLYLRGAIGNLAGGKKHKKQIIKDKGYKQQSIGIAYCKKEFKMLIRNPIFFMQCILPTVLLPIILIAVILTGSQELSQVIQNENFYSITNFSVLVGLVSFFFMMNFIAVTAISRDGLNAVFVKYLPIPLYKQFIYKIMPSILLNIFSVVLGIALLVYLVPEIALWYVILFGIACMIVNVIESYLMLIVDLYRPKLEWDTEYAVVKQNLNMAFQFGFTFVLWGLLFAISSISYKIPDTIMICALLAILGITWYFIDLYVRKNQNKLFDKIQ